jgi:hypothetical protein
MYGKFDVLLGGTVQTHKQLLASLRTVRLIFTSVEDGSQLVGNIPDTALSKFPIKREELNRGHYAVTRLRGEKI